MISPGEEGDTQVFWCWLAQLHFITRENETTRSPLSSLRQSGKGWGVQPVLVGPRPGPVQHWRPLRQRRAGMGLRK